MATFFKIFFGFWAIWCIWYITGGPLRDDKNAPFVKVNESGQLENVGTSSLR